MCIRFSEQASATDRTGLPIDIRYMDESPLRTPFGTLTRDDYDRASSIDAASYAFCEINPRGNSRLPMKSILYKRFRRFICCFN